MPSLSIQAISLPNIIVLLLALLRELLEANVRDLSLRYRRATEKASLQVSFSRLGI